MSGSGAGSAVETPADTPARDAGPALFPLDRASEPHPVPVRRPHGELPHAPGPILGRRGYVGSPADDLLVERVDALDLEIGEPGVIAERARKDRVPAPARHEQAPVPDEEAPVRLADLVDFEAQDITVEAGGHLEVGHGDHVAAADQARHAAHPGYVRNVLPEAADALHLLEAQRRVRGGARVVVEQ